MELIGIIVVIVRRDVVLLSLEDLHMQLVQEFLQKIYYGEVGAEFHKENRKVLESTNYKALSIMYVVSGAFALP